MIGPIAANSVSIKLFRVSTGSSMENTFANPIDIVTIIVAIRATLAFLYTSKGLTILVFLLKNGNAIARNIYGIVIATLVILIKVLKNTEAFSPPKETNNIRRATITP